ncbi:MAG: hypothetical protein H7061_01780 [Bdellovibrionaceae bacterium]|nr:hypothetical protein [Bdellovibrio sp.]
MKHVEKNLNLNISEPEISGTAAIEFSDVVVYHEMADQTAVRLNLFEQVSSQLQQLETMIQRREFVMKEIFQHITE